MMSERSALRWPIVAWIAEMLHPPKQVIRVTNYNFAVGL